MTKPLDRASLHALVRAAQGGDDRAVEALLRPGGPLTGLIAKIKRVVDPLHQARAWEPDPAPGRPDEADAAAYLGIMQALRAFDADRGVAFTTFAFPYIHGAMIRAIYPVVRRHGDGRPAPQIVPFRSETGDDGDRRGTEADLLDRDSGYGADPGYARVIRMEEIAAVRSFVRSLPERQRAIVHDVYFRGRTQDDIASERGVSRQAISKTLGKVLAHGRRDLADLGVAA